MFPVASNCPLPLRQRGKEDEPLAKIKDTDYLFLSTRIRALERSLLTRERMERMLDAPTPADAAKVLVECGYPEAEEVTVDSVNQMLSQARQRTFDDLYLFAPDRNIIDVFRVKYDYHNAKVLLKSEARGVDAGALLVDTGRVPPEELREHVRASDFRGCPAIWPGPSPRPGTPWAPPGTLSSATLCWTGPILRTCSTWPAPAAPPSWRAMCASTSTWPT